ncbi:hypothetical protein, partial [Bacteroides ovatus]
LIGLRKKKTVEIKKRLPPNLTKNPFIFCIHNNYLILYLLFISDVVNLFINVIIRKETWERHLAAAD